MGSIKNIFFLVIAINFFLVGSVAVISGIATLLKKSDSVKTPTSIFYIIAGAAAVYVGYVLSKDSF